MSGPKGIRVGCRTSVGKNGFGVGKVIVMILFNVHSRGYGEDKCAAKLLMLKLPSCLVRPFW